MSTTATTTSASQPKLLAAGWTSVTGIAILANPRSIPKLPQTIVLDVQLYLGPTDDDLLIGSLRYYNQANLSFDDGPNLYIIFATVSAQIVIRLNINRSIFSLLDEIPKPMCQFQAVDRFRITPLSVTYSG